MTRAMTGSLPYIPDNTDLLMRGWLEEAVTKGGREKRSKRWVVLRKRDISLYSDVVTSLERRLACYQMAGISDICYQNEPTQHWFSFRTPSGPIKFYAPDREDREKWLTALRTWV